ncbi:MAG: lysozyme inhibitor LprI family protein [Burkholderiaceae bacterium]|nr:lysozyme inhibitor LprI family protein [Burkholderiaceae bacterium]
MLSTTRFHRTLCVLALCLPAAQAAQAQTPTGGLQELLSVQGCGKPLPITIGNLDAFQQFNVDLRAYRKQEGAAIANALSMLCAKSPKYRAQIDGGVRQVRVINAQGADEPHPYLGGRVLLLEFAGGAINQGELQKAIAKALDAGSVVKPGFDCGKAKTPIEKLVCEEPELAQADADLQEAYKAARKQILAAHGDEKKLREDQRYWIKERDEQCSRGQDSNIPDQADAMVNCLRARYSRQIAALNVIGRPPTVVQLPAEVAIDGVYRNESGELKLSSQADGGVNFELDTQAPRGVCHADGKAVRVGASNYTFNDPDTACEIGITVRGNSASVGTDGNCFSAYCGVHALGLDGDYVRKPARK